MIRKVLERRLATAIGDFFHAANRELLFARERLSSDEDLGSTGSEDVCEGGPHEVDARG